MLFHRLVAYLRYRLQAKNRHGIHSPYVYWVSDVICRQKHHYYSWKAIEHERRQLLANRESLYHEDLGALGQSAQKRIASIASNSALQDKYGRLLFQLVLQQSPRTGIELGTSLGLGTAYLASANTACTWHTLEGSKEVLDQAKQVHQNLGLHNINTIHGNFDTTLPAILTSLPYVDVVFIDGNHHYDATMRYLNWCLPKLSANAMVIIDDIYWSSGMTKAWKACIALPDFELSMDFYRLGMLLRRPGQAKEHFVLQY